MRARMTLAAVVPMMLGLCSGRAAWADAPKTDTPAVKETTKIPEADRWFLVVPEGEENTKLNLHIVVKKSDKAEAPVRVTYEINIVSDEGRGQATIESLCLNDEWFSPVKISMTFKGDRKDNPPAISATITRPDPKSTAGKMKIEGGEGDAPEQEIKEHTVFFFTPLEMVLRMPFDKDKKLNYSMLDAGLRRSEDCTLSYAGEEEIEVKGKKVSAHKFVQKVGDGDKSDKFWLDAKHQLIRADLDHAAITPATKEEAAKALEGAKAPETPNPAK